jgi:hypothetical protein
VARRHCGQAEPPAQKFCVLESLSTNVFQLSQPGTFVDPLTEVLRDGARALLAQPVEAEVATLLSTYADETTEDRFRHQNSAIAMQSGYKRPHAVPYKGLELPGGCSVGARSIWRMSPWWTVAM